ncbi:uncharacterized protein LOC124290794 [Haliotis rubra]|uniref:uncharacterized protein LOC124290794 n=1 Tax=Haliotis rubra TaxID=36100 RepID=UPI001EE58898|nr:uncharacterized protein LOC124290794 [Haliotis rubra]
MAYSILVQARHHELSRVQRIMTMCLHDSTCEQKVFDRLQQIVVSLSYGRSLFLLNEVGGHFNDRVIQAVSEGRRFRIIGDNLNFHVDVQDMSKDRQSSNHHMFASAIILQTQVDNSMLQNVPQKRIDNLLENDVLISNTELDVVKDEYIKISV